MRVPSTVKTDEAGDSLREKPGVVAVPGGGSNFEDNGPHCGV